MITRRRLLTAALAAAATAPLAADMAEPITLTTAALERLVRATRAAAAALSAEAETIVRADLEQWFNLPEGSIECD